MSHLSVAIIRKQVDLREGEEAKDVKYVYLIIKDGRNNVQFFDFLNTAIGSRFDYSSFKEKIKEFFEFEKNRPETGGEKKLGDKEFKLRHKLFKHRKRDPHATAYIFELSKQQIDFIDAGLKSALGKWNDIEWVDEDNLKSAGTWKQDQLFLFEKETTFKIPEFPKEFRASLKNIVKARDNGKLVIFAGTGVSSDSSVPEWRKLIEILKGDLQTEESNFLEVAELYFKARGEKEYYEKIHEVLKHGETIYNPIHKMIVRLEPLHIVTTNYDNHFEQVIDVSGFPYSLVKCDTDLPYSKGSSLYVKMHGDFVERNLVLKKSDYLNYEVNFPLILTFLKETFASKLVLFIGFSFNDPNLDAILKNVNDILKEDIQPPYLFKPGKLLSEKDKLAFEKKGIKLIQFESGLNEYYEQIELNEDSEMVESLSEKGKESYKFLRVLEKFDISSDTLENLETPNQFANSLARFSEIGAIPIDTLVSISPFKIKNNPKNDVSYNAEYNSYQPFLVETLNEDFLDFLNARKNDKKQIEFFAYRNSSVSADEQQINKGFKLLYSSGIYYVKRKHDTQSEYFSLSPKNKEPRCECHRCLNDRFELRKLLSSLNTISIKSICKNEFQEDGLLEAYAFLKSGQPVKAYYALEDVKRRAIKKQKYITHFLACYNQVNLKSIIKFSFEQSFNESDVESIVEQIESIDLYKVLSSTPVDKDLKSALKIILSDSILQTARAEMEEEFVNIEQRYKNFRSAQYSSWGGPIPWYKFQASFFMVWNFYHKTLSFNDESFLFKKTANLYLEGMLISFATATTDNYKLKSFSKFFVDTFINYGFWEDLKKTLDGYSLTYLELGFSTDDVLQDCFSWLESGYHKSTAFEERIERDPLFDSLVLQSSYLERRSVRTLNNFLLLLSHLELDESQVNAIIARVINYLVVSNLFGYADSHKNFSDFLSRHIAKVNEVSISKIMSYALTDNIWPGNIIWKLGNSIALGNKVSELFGKEEYDKMICRANERREWPLKVSELLPIYSLLKTEQKVSYANLYKSVFQEEKSDKLNLMQSANYWRMWNPVNNEVVFNDFFSHASKSVADFPEYPISTDGLPIGNDFKFWNTFYFIARMVYTYDLFEKDFVKTIRGSAKKPILRWIFEPKEFDYNQFESRWIVAFNRPEFLKKLGELPEFRNGLMEKLKVDYNPKASEILFNLDKQIE